MGRQALKSFQIRQENLLGVLLDRRPSPLKSGPKLLRPAVKCGFRPQASGSLRSPPPGKKYLFSRRFEITLKLESLRSFYKLDPDLTALRVPILNSIFCIVKMSFRVNFPKIYALKTEDMPGRLMPGPSEIISRSVFQGEKEVWIHKLIRS
jgi:hypothetical protein